MKIGLRGGHSPNCKGAMGLLDEQIEVRKLCNETKMMLEQVGHEVVDCNSNAGNVVSELVEGTDKANTSGCDIYVTLHMNASNGVGNGFEVWLYNSSNGGMNEIANQMCKNFEDNGFQNRGKKFNTGYHDLSASNMPAMIVETLFCDNSYDVGLYQNIGVNGVAEMIAKAIDKKASIGSGNRPTSKPTPEPVMPSKPDITPAVNFTYAVRVEGGEILPSVTNLNDFAGISGKKITDVTIKVDKGEIRYRVHLLGGSWLPWVTGYNWNDHNNGYAGNGSPIDAVQIYYETSPDYAVKYGYQKAQYRVAPVNGEYWPWQYDEETENGQDGYAGCFGIAIDKFQLF